VSNAPEPPIASPGKVVATACRGYIQFEAATPHTVFRGQRIYFCLPSCLKAFEDDPKTSCLAGHPLLEEGG
jgi:YHS domain-containing protein